jgi:phosphopantetheinyl transferase
VPLFYQQDINPATKLGIWKIDEPEDFFLARVSLQRGITHPQKRLQHLAGRFLLPYLFPDFPEQEIVIADTRKPFLPGEQYHFSISHCGGYAAAIVSSTHRVGIDIEMITPRVERIKHKFLHADELSFVQELPLEKQIALLTLLWSVKEALFKWWGRTDVDFSEVLRFSEFYFQDTGLIPAAISKEALHIPLEVHYAMLEEMSLAWVVNNE